MIKFIPKVRAKIQKLMTLKTEVFGCEGLGFIAATGFRTIS